MRTVDDVIRALPSPAVPTCSVTGCNAPVAVIKRGLCGSHYDRWKRHGTPSPARETTEDRFWSRVDKHGPIPTHRRCLGRCWVWTHGTYHDGYGLLCVGNQKLGRAHRYSWSLWHGTVGPGVLILHKCDNPLCVRPSHLFSGSHQENMMDKVKKGRQQKGEEVRNTKLTEEQVKEARRRFLLGGLGNRSSDLAKEFGVHKTVMGLLLRRKTWKHVI